MKLPIFTIVCSPISAATVVVIAMNTTGIHPTFTDSLFHNMKKQSNEMSPLHTPFSRLHCHLLCNGPWDTRYQSDGNQGVYV